MTCASPNVNPNALTMNYQMSQVVSRIKNPDLDSTRSFSSSVVSRLLDLYSITQLDVSVILSSSLQFVVWLPKFRKSEFPGTLNF